MAAPPQYAPRPSPALDSLDFETASIRSAAPSYTSEAPSYHSTFPSTRTNSLPSTSSFSPLGPSAASSARIHARHNSEPSLSDFRIPTWSTTRSNPTARHYQSVANRRASIASARGEQRLLSAAMARNPLGALVEKVEKDDEDEFGVDVVTIQEDGRIGIATVDGREGRRVRPLEDPDLVGEEAAEIAKTQRLVREGKLGIEVLYREDRRWDWLIGQMKDWEEREKSWNKFRAEIQEGKRSKLAGRLGLKRSTTRV